MLPSIYLSGLSTGFHGHLGSNMCTDQRYDVPVGHPVHDEIRAILVEGEQIIPATALRHGVPFITL